MSATLFLLLVLGVLLLVPALAAGLRRALPERRRRVIRVAPIAFGVSEKIRRSPRHAVRSHRGLMGSLFTALVAVALLPAATALGDVGPGLILPVMAFVLPTLLVALHAGRRSREG